MRPGRVNKPWPVPVEAGDDGRPRRVGRLAVASIREEWLVEDGWWTANPLRRSYFEVVLEDGSDVVVFSEPGSRARPLVPAARLMGRPEALPYVELHCHSAYSFRDGASDPAELAGAAAELGYEALALTDHDGVSGAMEFAHACSGVGVRPIVGAELTGRGWLAHHAARRVGRGLVQPLPADHPGPCRDARRRGDERGRHRDARGPPPFAPAGRARVPRRRAGLPVGLRARGRRRRALGARRPDRRGGDGAAAALGLRARTTSGSSCSARCGATTARATAGSPRSPARSASRASRPATSTPTSARGWPCRTRWSRSASARPWTRARACAAATARRRSCRRPGRPRASATTPRPSPSRPAWPSGCASTSPATSATAIPAPRTPPPAAAWPASAARCWTSATPARPTAPGPRRGWTRSSA